MCYFVIDEIESNLIEYFSFTWVRDTSKIYTYRNKIWVDKRRKFSFVIEYHHLMELEGFVNIDYSLERCSFSMS